MTTFEHRSGTGDGTRFHNPDWMTDPSRIAKEDMAGPKGRLGFGQILRWRLSGTRKPWPDRIVDPAPSGDPFAEPEPGSVSVTFIGHSCFLIRLPGLVILTDPMFSERASPVSWAGPKRVRPPGRVLEGLPRVDLVLLSHNHYDHCDLPSLRALHRHSATLVVTPLGNARLVRKAASFEVCALDWWQCRALAKPVAARITVVPARHFSARTPRDAGRALWGGFVVEAGGVRLLFGGDSGWGQHWRLIGERIGAPDLALLPIGAYDPRALMRGVHMDPEEAVRAHLALGATQSIGMHFGTFQLTDEAIDEPERRLKDAALAQGVAAGRFETLAFGECRFYRIGGGTASVR